MFCGDGACDSGYNPPETCTSCPTDCGYCDGHSCTSGGQCQGHYCVCGHCASSPPPAGHCCSDVDCPADTYGAWGNPYCGTDGNVYHSRTFYNHFCNANKQCDLTTSTDVALLHACTNGCTAGVCNTCTPHDHLGCVAPDIYWFDSCNNQQGINDTCSTHNTVGPWGTNYCVGSNVWHNHTKTYYGCTAGDTACRITSTDVVQEQVQACQYGCTAGACNPGCSDAPNCVVHTNTGCSLDFVNRWWCADTNSDGCYEQTYETCTAGHCDAGTHLCVAGCTSDAGCDDNNVCTGPDTCTRSTGVCDHPALPSSQTCVNGTLPGHCDGQGNCVADACTDPRDDATVCGAHVCGTVIDECGVPRDCGSCAVGTCDASGQCVPSCTPNCTGKSCGGDGCGGSCGSCNAGYMCNAYQCELNQVVLEPHPESVTVTAGFSFSIWYNLTPDYADLQG